MSNFGDEQDAKTLTEFWDYLSGLMVLSPEWDTDANRVDRVTRFLAERREKRERDYR